MSMHSTENRAPVKRINRLAVGSLLLAAIAVAGVLLSGVGVVAVFAVGAGHVALNQINLRGERGKGLALVALAIGYAIATFALVSTIYSAVTFAMQQAPM
jgi:hypothetical protein